MQGATVLQHCEFSMNYFTVYLTGSSSEWRRRENRQQYARPLRRRVHPPRLHPCRPADAEPGSGNHGEFYGANHVTTPQRVQKARQEGETSCLALSVPHPTFRRTQGARAGSKRQSRQLPASVGHGVGQAQNADALPNQNLIRSKQRIRPKQGKSQLQR